VPPHPRSMSGSYFQQEVDHSRDTSHLPAKSSAPTTSNTTKGSTLAQHRPTPRPLPPWRPHLWARRQSRHTHRRKLHTEQIDHGDAHFMQGLANIIGTALLT
jgi:hypothetical protein